MAIKPSREMLTKMAQVTADILASPGKPKTMLQSMDGHMFYMVVGDQIICWSDNPAEVEAALEGKVSFAFSERDYVTPPNVRVTFPFLAVPSAEEQRARRARELAERAERNWIERKKLSLQQGFSEMLATDNSMLRRERIADLKLLNQRLGLHKITDATTRKQVFSYGLLLGAWKMKEKAGMS